MKNLIIIGRSPFINKVDVKALKYDKLFINTISEDAKYILSFDDVFKNQELPCEEYISPSMGYEFIKQVNFNKSKPYLLGYSYFSISAAVNFAYLKDYKNVYLVGIDHIVQQGTYRRNDGSISQEVASELHIKIKEFIYQFKSEMNIFQTNPDTDWDLPYTDITKLYKGNDNGRMLQRRKKRTYDR